MGRLLELLGNRVALLLARLGIGAIFAVAGLAKIGDLAAFSDQVRNFRILPVGLVNLVAMTLPWVEVVAGVVLIVVGLAVFLDPVRAGAHEVRVRAAAVLATLLMAAFTIGVASAVARGLDFECGCFGTSDATTVGATKLMQNLGMTAMAAVASLRGRG